MLKIDLVRVSYSHLGTYGTLACGGIPFAVTLEPHWVDNLKNYSCIPEGSYVCKRVNSPTYGLTFEVTGVNGRTAVLFHWGNEIDNTEGCILLGEEFGELGNSPAILSSKRAFAEFMGKFNDHKEIILFITSLHGLPNER